MMKKIVAVVLVSLFLFALNCSKDSNPVVSNNPTVAKDDMAAQVHGLINSVRKSKGLSTLSYNDQIAAIALTHSQNMAGGSVPFSHDGFEERAQAIADNIKISAAAENVAWNRGYSDPAKTAVEGWIDSPGHYDNIIGDFNTTGIGVAVNDKGEYYFTQLFAKRN